MSPSSENTSKYHPDLIKVMKNGPNHCPFCANYFTVNSQLSFAKLVCNKCDFKPEIYDEKDTGAYNYIDFYINVFDIEVIVEVAARFLQASYNPEQQIFSLPLNQLNFNNLDQVTSKIKTYIIFS